MSEHTTQIPEIRRLQRSRSDRMLAGVSGGLARYFEIHPAVFRVGFVVLTLLGGAGILHLRRRGARHARRGQGGLDRHGGAPQPARPPVAADRARPPRRGGRHPAVAGDAVARRRRVVAVPARGRPDPLDHAAAGGGPGDGCEGARGRGLAPRATRVPPCSPSSWRPSSRSCSSPSRPSWPCSTCTSAAASASATYVPTTMQELRDDYRLGIGSLELDLSRAAAPAGRDAPRDERRRRRPAR